MAKNQSYVDFRRAEYEENQRKMAVSWACGTLRNKGYMFEAVADPKIRYCWDLLTSEGWIGINSLNELIDAARTLPKYVAGEVLPL